MPYRARAALDLAAVLDAQGRADEADAVAGPAVADLERLGAWQWLAGLTVRGGAGGSPEPDAA